MKHIRKIAFAFAAMAGFFSFAAFADDVVGVERVSFRGSDPIGGVRLVG